MRSKFRDNLKIEKIVLNVGIGQALSEPQFKDLVKENLLRITGQKPIETKAKKAISGFKVKKGQKVGVMVTLRRKRMRDFFNKLVNIALPRTRDFRGISPSSFDGRGNLTIGLKEVNVFPEVPEGVKPFGLEVSIKTKVKTDKEAKELLKDLGLPFKE